MRTTKPFSTMKEMRDDTVAALNADNITAKEAVHRVSQSINLTIKQLRKNRLDKSSESNPINAKQLPVDIQTRIAGEQKETRLRLAEVEANYPPLFSLKGIKARATLLFG